MIPLTTLATRFAPTPSVPVTDNIEAVLLLPPLMNPEPPQRTLIISILPSTDATVTAGSLTTGIHLFVKNFCFNPGGIVYKYFHLYPSAVKINGFSGNCPSISIVGSIVELA